MNALSADAARLEVGHEPQARPTASRDWGLLITAAVAMVLVVVTSALAAGSRPAGEFSGQPASLLDSAASYRASFVGASLLPAVLALLILQLLRHARRSWLREQLGLLLLAAHVTLTLVASSTQYALLPRLLLEGDEAARAWYLPDPSSIPMGLQQSGQGALGVAAALLAIGPLLSGSKMLGSGLLLLGIGLAGIGGLGAYAHGADSVAAAFNTAGLALTFSLGLAGVWLAIHPSRLRDPSAEDLS